MNCICCKLNLFRCPSIAVFSIVYISKSNLYQEPNPVDIGAYSQFTVYHVVLLLHS